MHRARELIVSIAAVATALLLGGCGLNGDFGRVRDSLITDDMHAWVGKDAARGAGAPVSDFPLTDEERLLRDLAFPLIEPPYDRQRWFSVLNEYGYRGIFDEKWLSADRKAYYLRLHDRSLLTHLQGEAYRSASGQYAKLIEDIRNDVVRVCPFFDVGRRVADLDSKRAQSLAYVSHVTGKERKNMLARIGENSLIVSWVARSLSGREQSYRYALERMVIATPSPFAAEAERALRQLRQTINACHAPLAPPQAIARAEPPVHVSK